MNNQDKFNDYRNTYKEFYYNSYKATEDDENIYIEFDFEIVGLINFTPKLRIPKKKFCFKDIQTKQAQNMIFNIGMIELVSYWKASCCPQVTIKCGYLNQEQIDWWKKIYFYGLGEMFFVNGIKTSFDEFMTINCIQTKDELFYEKIEDESNGYIVPIGGGKDSVVTLETLQIDRKNDYCLIINPKPVTIECAKIAGLDDNNILEVYRIIDKKLIDLNNQGFLNGHTPFSAMLAFVSYLIAYLTSKKYVALSNENSANESNVVGEKINHQYSKSFEFECDFRNYAEKYLKAPVSYFSFLRPLNELQIAKIFSRQEKYHKVFKSCNVGSKGETWKWCCNCSKCLFAYIILSPYLYKEKLVNIFGEDLYEKKDFLKTFIELTGNGETKPFDCVGTYEEVNFAISKTIKNLGENIELPYLLNYYKETYKLVDVENDITLLYNEENNLNEEQNGMLRKEVFKND